MDLSGPMIAEVYADELSYFENSRKFRSIMLQHAHSATRTRNTHSEIKHNHKFNQHKTQ